MNWISAKLLLTGVDGVEYIVDGKINDFSIETQTELQDITEFGNGFRHSMPGVRTARMDVSIMVENMESLFRSCDAFSAAGDNKVEEVKDRLFRKLNI